LPGGHDGDNSANWVIQARSRLALRRAEKPATKAGQIRALWPDIEAALAVGQSVKSICKWLEEGAGVALGVTSLTSYISRIRRREAMNRSSAPPIKQVVRERGEPTLESPPPLPSTRVPGANQSAQTHMDDPLAPAMRVLSKPKMDIRKIHNDGDPEGRNLI
jgi:hypothetical protein